MKQSKGTEEAMSYTEAAVGQGVKRRKTVSFKGSWFKHDKKG